MESMVSRALLDSVNLNVMFAFAFIPNTSGFSKSGNSSIIAL
jgi:hypothetical protein